MCYSPWGFGGFKVLTKVTSDSTQKAIKHPVFADPLWVGNNLLLLDVEGKLQEISLQGEVLGSLDLHSYLRKGGLCHLAPVIQGSVCFISCSSGEIVKVDLLTKQIIGLISLEDSSCMN